MLYYTLIMPRKDGLPTNEEMLYTFNGIGRDVFVAAYNRDFLASEVPKWLVGKQIGNIVLKISRNNSPDEDSTGLPILRETLQMSLPSVLDSDFVQHFHLRWQGDTTKAETMLLTTMVIGSLAVGETISADELPNVGVITDWTGFRNRQELGRTRHVGTLKEKPAKKSLAAGISMAGDALQYVNTSKFDRTPKDLLINAIFGGDEEFDNYRHEWRLPYSPDIKYSGYESLAYLERLYTSVQLKIETRKKMLERFNELCAPAEFTEGTDYFISQHEESLKNIAAAIAQNKLRTLVDSIDED
jgi:hypothetical protein